MRRGKIANQHFVDRLGLVDFVDRLVIKFGNEKKLVMFIEGIENTIGSIGPQVNSLAEMDVNLK